MSISENITSELKKAIKERDKKKLAVLRGLKSAIKYREIQLRDNLDDDQILGIISSEMKQRKESIEQFSRGSRQDLVVIEEEELKILSSYLPPQLSIEEIREIITQVIKELSSVSIKDLGKVMKTVMPKLSGKADGKTVNKLVKELLT